MTETTFPKPHHLGRPALIRETIDQRGNGIGLISGKPCSGVTTTLATLGNSFVETGTSVVHLRLNDDESLPGIDSISTSELNDSMIGYLVGKEKPRLVIIDNVDDPAIAGIAYRIAQQGVFVLMGIHANSVEDAISRFADLHTLSKGLSSYYGNLEHMVCLSVYQSFVAPKEDPSNRQKGFCVTIH